MFGQFGAPFSKATKVPAGMAREITKMKRKHAMIVHLKAQAAAGLAAEGDEQKLNEAESPDDNDFINCTSRFFLMLETSLARMMLMFLIYLMSRN